MLQLLHGKISFRKLRLFLCACCRSFWPLLVDEQSKKAVEIAELYADGLTRAMTLDLAHEQARAVFGRFPSRPDDSFEWLPGNEHFLFAHAARQASSRQTFDHDNLLSFHRWFCCAGYDRPPLILFAALSNAQIVALRDLFGNPFHLTTVKPTWQTSNVVALGQSIYADRAFDRLPILADALEDAGCDNADILNHCRQPAEHVRGCWVVDLILGKS
jgi:hypothetical protein